MSGHEILSVRKGKIFVCEMSHPIRYPRDEHEGSFGLHPDDAVRSFQGNDRLGTVGLG